MMADEYQRRVLEHLDLIGRRLTEILEYVTHPLDIINVDQALEVAGTMEREHQSAEMEYPLMLECGVEGHLFRPHARIASCAAAGCVPVSQVVGPK